MTTNPNLKTRLELTWVGKDRRPRLEPRILIEDKSLSYSAPKPEAVLPEDAGPAATFDNLLIHGDNLLALKALEQQYAGKVKCIFIDPPYNTGSAFTHYDDGVEHSLWLTLMRDRLELLRTLLSEDGSIWITIDDGEAHYLKVLCDEVFGRSNFVAHVVWEKVYSERMDAQGFSAAHDHVLVFRKTEQFFPRRLKKAQNDAQFGFFDESVKKYYRRRSLRKEGSESLRSDRPSMWYPISAPDDSLVWPVKPDGTEGRWRWKADNAEREKSSLDFVKREDRWEIYVRQYLEIDPTRPPSTIWPNGEVGNNHEAKLEARSMNDIDVFQTPKPERLAQRILEIATTPNDLVLDSFAGSGTTGAVAQKMGRRWIMVELGDHCRTHIVPRLRKVIDGADPGGVTPTTGWRGGGSFRYLNLAPSLLKRDAWGNWVINPAYDAEMLAEAMCKHMGYTYAPSAEVYWQHGRSTERDHLYVTTGSLTHGQLRALSAEVGDERTLLICCKAFMADARAFANLSIKKIPQAVLAKCEWDQADDRLRLPVGEGATSPLHDA